MAVLDTDVTSDAVALVAGVDVLEAETSAGRLADTGLVAGVRFRPSAAAAVVGGLRGPEKARLHARAAEVKQSRGLPATEVARHLVAAGEAEVDWALPVLVGAAEQVMLGDDIDFATRCLKLAASVATAPWEQQTISQLMAKITWRVNPASAAPHLESLRQAGDSLDQSDRIALARQSLWFGDRETFERAFVALENDVEPLDPRTAAELSLAGHWHYGASASTGDAERPLAPDGEHAGRGVADRARPRRPRPAPNGSCRTAGSRTPRWRRWPPRSWRWPTTTRPTAPKAGAPRSARRPSIAAR